MGRSKQIDALTDVWAVGATLFSLLSGHYVHEGESAQELMIKSATVPARWSSAAAMGDAIAAGYRGMYRKPIAEAMLSSLLADAV